MRYPGLRKAYARVDMKVKENLKEQLINLVTQMTLF